MSPQDTLRDRLADAAGSTDGRSTTGRSTTGAVPAAADVRRAAVRHRTHRRVAAGAVVTVAVAAVAVAGSTLLGPRTTSLGPATSPPVPVTTSAPAPTTATTGPLPSSPVTTAPPTTDAPSTPVGPPALTASKARAGVESLRFVHEEEWRADQAYELPDLPQDEWVTSACSDPVPLTGAPLAARTLGHATAEHLQSRQLVVYADAAAAAAGFAEMRTVLRACHEQPRVTTYEGSDGADQTRTITVLGGRLELGDESFWVGDKEVVTADEADPEMVGEEMFWSVGQLYVLDDNVVTVLLDLAAFDEGRERFVSGMSAEWEQLRPAYGGLRRS